MRICPDCRAESDSPRCPACGTDTVSAALVGRARDPLMGSVLRGTWRIDTPIGSGGMGSVYSGRQIAIDREVAIKVLRVEGQTPDQVLKMVKRFRLEARVMSQLRHPASVQVLDFGESDPGQAPSLPLTIRSVGPNPVTLCAVERGFGTSAEFEFVLQSGLPTALAPGAVT